MTICTTAGSRKHYGNTIALIGNGCGVKNRRRDFPLPEEPDARKSTRDRIDPLKSQTCRTHPAKPVFQDTQLAVNFKKQRQQNTRSRHYQNMLQPFRNVKEFLFHHWEIAHCWYTNHEKAPVTNIASYRKILFFTVIMMQYVHKIHITLLDKAIYTQVSLKTVNHPMKNPRLTVTFEKT